MPYANVFLVSFYDFLDPILVLDHFMETMINLCVLEFKGLFIMVQHHWHYVSIITLCFLNDPPKPTCTYDFNVQYLSCLPCTCICCHINMWINKTMDYTNVFLYSPRIRARYSWPHSHMKIEIRRIVRLVRLFLPYYKNIIHIKYQKSNACHGQRNNHAHKEMKLFRMYVGRFRWPKTSWKIKLWKLEEHENFAFSFTFM